jgi:hypothetical protein
MTSIAVRSAFWNDQVTSNLRLVVPLHIGFRKSDKILPDFIFPSFGSICFCIIQSSNLTASEAERVNAVAAASKILILIVYLEEEFRASYSEFICCV